MRRVDTKHRIRKQKRQVANPSEIRNARCAAAKYESLTVASVKFVLFSNHNLLDLIERDLITTAIIPMRSRSRLVGRNKYQPSESAAPFASPEGQLDARTLPSRTESRSASHIPGHNQLRFSTKTTTIVRVANLCHDDPEATARSSSTCETLEAATSSCLNSEENL